MDRTEEYKSYYRRNREKILAKSTKWQLDHRNDLKVKSRRILRAATGRRDDERRLVQH